MSKINSSQIIADYKAAFLAANKHPIEVTCKNGWYHSVFFRWRAKMVVMATLILNNRAKNKSNGFYN